MNRLLLAAALSACTACLAQTARPKIIDAHVHHNGDLNFLKKLVAKLESVDGMAVILVKPADLESTKVFIARHPNRLVGFGDVSLDDPNACELAERFVAAGFRGLGEILRPLKNYDDRSYWPLYELAEKRKLILLFHTGILARSSETEPEDTGIERMRPGHLDVIARRFPKLTIVGAHLGNPDYATAAEIARWNSNLYFDLTGSTLIKKQEDYTFFKSIFWWSSIVSPHTPKSKVSAFEKTVFGSDIFGGEIEEFDRSLERYKRMLDTCGVSKEAQANIFAGTMWRLLNNR